MKKSLKIRRNIRIVLMCLDRYSLNFPKDIWYVLLNKLPPNRSKTDDPKHMMDMPCNAMINQSDFLNGLRSCLEQDIVFARNPLLCTDGDPFSSGIMLQYGTNLFLSYPAFFAKFRAANAKGCSNNTTAATATTATTATTTTTTTTTRQTYQVLPLSEIFLGVQTRGKWPAMCWINGVEITDVKEIVLSSVYTKNVGQTSDAQLSAKLIYFPELGPLIVNKFEPIVIELPKTPKTQSISFTCAFGVYSPIIQNFFTNKKIKYN